MKIIVKPVKIAKRPTDWDRSYRGGSWDGLVFIRLWPNFRDRREADLSDEDVYYDRNKYGFRLVRSK
jgi:hypothetical protein